jgi:hypothetical protein
VEFRRLSPGSPFKCRSGEGDFRIKRPSGPKITREGLELTHPEHDYNVRTQGKEVWLLDGDREVGYAAGDSSEWDLLFGEDPYALEQPKIGNNATALMQGDERVGEIDGKGFPLRKVGLEIRASLSDEQKAFVAMIALLGWRESDRSLFSSVDSGAQFDATSN